MQNNQALISIAMATYNGEKYVREQLETILHQTLRPFEIIITDDGSSDDTIAVIKEMQAQFPIVHLYELPVNGGVMPPDMDDGAPGPAALAENGALAAALMAAVSALPPEQRTAFLLRAEGDLSVEEIAEVTG
ncbi:MAG: glycosyltransferase, partial [Pedobacter sp.]